MRRRTGPGRAGHPGKHRPLPRRGTGTGTRIVHCCGFDSVPSDLGVLLLHQAARMDGTGDLAGTTLVVTALRGGISAGTLASGMGQWDETAASAERRAVVEDPYAHMGG